MIAAVAELVARAFVARLDPPETWALICHHHPAVTGDDVIAALAFWGRQVERQKRKRRRVEAAA